MIQWLPEAETQRDITRLHLHGKALARFERDLKDALEQIEMFPDPARMLTLTQNRGDLRELVFGGGYRLVYGIPAPDEIWVTSFIHPGSGQALD